MDNATLALIFSLGTPAAVIITGLLTQFIVRRNAKENIEIGKIQQNLDAFETRAVAAETKASAAEAKAEELAERVTILEDKDHARERQLTRIRQAVQDWFRELKAWARQHGIEADMPLPSDEELELLGLDRTLPKSEVRKITQNQA